MLDYHVHTYHSPDSETKPEAACKSAVSAGLKEIAFTDHMDIDWPTGMLFEIENLQKYTDEILKVKDEYKYRLKVKLGIEMGLQPHTLRKSEEITGRYPFDFVLASVHLVKREDPYLAEYYEHRNKIKSYIDYYEEVYMLLKMYDCYNVLGHLDYLRRYMPYEYNPGDARIGEDIVDEILKLLVERGKGLEVNTSGYRHASNAPMPHLNVIKRFREIGGEIITIGSDAHTPDMVGFGQDRAVEEIKKAGFSYLASFSDMKPTFIKI